MKKTVAILALTLGFSIANVNATISEYSSDSLEINLLESKASPLCTAIAKGDVDKVKVYLDQGVDLSAKSNGMLPIHYAARYNRVEIIKLLITAGSEIHVKCDKGYSAVKHAQITNATEAEQFLKRFKA